MKSSIWVLCPITPIPDSVILPTAFTTSKISKNQVPHSNSVIINSRPCIIIYSKNLTSVSPLTLSPCAHHSCIFRIYCVSACFLFIPDLTPIAPPFSLTKAIPVDSYIRLLVCMISLCLIIDFDFCH